jgi:hypothetical protein
MTDLRIPEKYLNDAVERLMRGGHYSLEEATQIAIDDWRIDHGDRCEWEPTVEEEKAMRKATKVVGERKKSATPVKRERKEDAVKQELIALLAEALGAYGEDVVVTNKERMIAFNVGEDSFEVMLTKKRKAKK